MKEPIHISVLCGGQSTEHDISLISARNVVRALDPKRYCVHVVYIARDGRWYGFGRVEDFLTHTPAQWLEAALVKPLLLNPGHPKMPWFSPSEAAQCLQVDCVFPVLHGTRCEDGAPQGVFEMLNVPYVGADIASSAVCMDKHLSKQLFRQAGIPTANWQLIHRRDRDQWSYAQLSQQLGDVLMVKSVGLGSSIGVSKVTDAASFEEGLDEAFSYQDRVIVEQYIVGREIECSVLGNEQAQASLPGEIVCQHAFYSYAAKYLEADAAKVVTPADLSENIIEACQAMAIKAYQALQCRGMARVDFFLDKQSNLFVNEINTIPGFTDISMYPKNWAVSGMSIDVLLDRLIDLALSAHTQQQMLSQVRQPEAKRGAST